MGPGERGLMSGVFGTWCGRLRGRGGEAIARGGKSRTWRGCICQVASGKSVSVDVCWAEMQWRKGECNNYVLVQHRLLK